MNGDNSQMQEQPADQETAPEQEMQDRVADLTPEQRDAVEQCSSLATGRINALRLAQQTAAEQGESAATRMNQQSFQQGLRSLLGADGADERTVVSACLENPYYYETIPSPPPQSPQTRPGGGQSLWEQCLAAQAAGAAAC